MQPVRDVTSLEVALKTSVKDALAEERHYKMQKKLHSLAPTKMPGFDADQLLKVSLRTNTTFSRPVANKWTGWKFRILSNTTTTA